jgi:signal transduction histidine kinase
MTSVIAQMEQLQIPAALLSENLLVIEANSTFATALGRSPDSLVALPVVVLLEECASRSIGTGPAAAYRIELNGRARWTRLDVKPTSDGPVAMLIDVSGECEAIDNIRSFYSTRDSLLHDGKIGTWRYDPDTQTYQFSSELSLGHEPATAPVPVTVLQLIQHPDDKEKDTEIRERITRNGGFTNSEMRYREANGSWTHLNVHYRAGRKLPSGKYEMFGISQNITAVAMARDEANQISKRLALALRAARAAVFEYDYALKSFSASPEMEDLLGREVVIRAREKPLSLFGGSDRARALALFEGASSASHPRSIDLLVILRDEQRWMRFYFGVTRRDPDGQPILGVGLLIDIDEHKRQEIALSEAQRAAEFANRTKTEFLANMSHELRTPLNAILGFSQIIESRMFGATSDKYSEYARDIHNSGQHLLELVNDVLDLAKLEAGKLELHESVVSLPDLVDDCLLLVRGRAEKGRLRIATRLENLRITADKRSVKQLLLNFLTNAIKFTPEFGCVTVQVDHSEVGDIYLSISDTGIGMTASEIKVALSPFGQVDSKLARKNEGTGLGLPICKSLMELHGGELVVSSAPGEGTTVTARFPSYRAVQTDMAAEA